MSTSAPMAENVVNALCYLGLIITGVLFLFLEPYNRNKTVRFHAMQSILIFLVLVVGEIALQILFGIFTSIGGWYTWAYIWWRLHQVYFLLCAAVWIFLMYKAYNNERYVLPIIGPIAEKQA